MLRNTSFTQRATLLGSTALLAVGLGATTASAQNEAATEEIEEVIVTGSRIKNANISSPSPVTVVGGAEVNTRGVVRIEDLLHTLPQTVASQGAGDFGGDGTATVDLRGLGSDRTLVLVDGRRLPYGQSNNTAADLNQIPEDLVERIEVLTGGASAVYGADAVAGVVNFIMKRDFEGVIIDGQMGINQTGNKSDRFAAILEDGDQPVPGSQLDGFEYKTSITVGVNSEDGKGNITAYFTYREANEIRQSDRIASACAFGGGDPEFFCLGSSTTRPARIASFGLANTSQFDLLAFDPNTGVTRDIVLSGSPNDTFNFASTQRTRAPQERFTIGMFSHYELTDNIEMYMDLAYADSTSEGQIGPSGTFFATDTINCDNPFLTDIQLDAICTQNGLSGSDLATAFIGRRNVEGGPRQFSNSNQTFRVTGGFRGDINESWSYDINGQFARVTNVQVSVNDLVEERLQRAFLVVNDADGNPVCSASLPSGGLPAVDPACVPYNVFQPGGITQEALDYISVPAFESGTVRQEIINATFIGDLGQHGLTSPWADSGLQFVGGFEYRNDSLDRQADDLQARGQVVGGGTILPIAAAVNVYEFFGELAIPLVEGAEFAEELSANAAYRYSDYSTTGTQSTYSFGLSWVPIPDVKFRGQYARAIRAPNIFELFLGQNNSSLFDLSDPDGDGIFDPCAGANPAATQAQCANTGVTAAQYGNVVDNPAGQFNQTVGGNPNLDVETADTYTVGVVITPEAVQGLILSVDYFNIEVDNFIGTIPPQLTLSNCLSTGDPLFCSLIQRDAGGGLFVDGDTSTILATDVNTGSLKTTGIDINASYSFNLGDGFGDISLRYTGTYLMDYEEISVPGEEAFECAGFYASNCEIPRPKYSHTAGATWQPETDASVTLAWRRIGGVRQFGTAENSTNRSSQLRAINYIDIAGSFGLTENIRMRAGITNVFDVLPPTSSALPAGLGTGNTFPAQYDTNGRYAFMGVTVEF